MRTEDAPPVAPDYQEQDMEGGPPAQLIVPHHFESGNSLRLLNRLQSLGYEVAKEYNGDSQTVYGVYPKPDRETPQNREPPSLRGGGQP